jgi:hypothetical protein
LLVGRKADIRDKRIHSSDRETSTCARQERTYVPGEAEAYVESIIAFFCWSSARLLIEIKEEIRQGR